MIQKYIDLIRVDFTDHFQTYTDSHVFWGGMLTVDTVPKDLLNNLMLLEVM